MLECEACQLGKHVRISFLKKSESRSNSRSNSVFSIVHFNICRVVSHLLVLSILLLSLMNILDVLGFILQRIVQNFCLSLHPFLMK